MRIISALRDEGVLHSLDEANALLTAAEMPPLYAGLPAEAALIRAWSTALLPEQVPALEWSTRRGVPHNLPALLTSFIGREQEITELAAQLQKTRLLMLAGPGGVGKSRLALQVSDEALKHDHSAHHFADGVWLAQLAPVSVPSWTADAIATVLNLRSSERPTRDALFEYLRDKCMLLILDNCEHLIEACAELVEALLHACPRVHILATSREPLGIAGKIIWRVPPLPGDAAFHLFVDRARAVRPGYIVGEHNVAAITQICTQLDGIPLAIELAAARVQTFTVEQIAARLDDRFRLLTTGNRTALPRHRTLRAMIDWSYDLLPDHERALLRHASIFAGGWTLETIARLCKDKVQSGHEEVQGGSALPENMLDALAQLVNKSLVSMLETPLGARYGLHETIRQYARERLIEHGELDSAQRRHAVACLDLVERRDFDTRHQMQRQWVDSLEREQDNVRAALTWCLSSAGDPVLGLKIASLSSWFWAICHQAEGYSWLERLLQRTAADAPLEVRGSALAGFGYLAGWVRPNAQQRILEEARTVLQQVTDSGPLCNVLCLLTQHAASAEEGMILLEEAMNLTRQDAGSKRWNLHFLALHLGPAGWCQDVGRAKAALEEARILAIQAQDWLCLAFVLNDLSAIEIFFMDYAQARRFAVQALEVAQSIDMQVPILDALSHLGEIAQITHQWDEAENIITSLQALGIRYGLSYAGEWSLILRLKMARDAGEHHQARQWFAHLARQHPRADQMAAGIETLACVESEQANHLRAAQLFGAAEAERERRHHPWWPKDHAQLDPYINASREHLGETAFAAAWAEGRAMPIDEVFNRESSP